jgi:para-aminobenzoate synthetase component 1
MEYCVSVIEKLDMAYDSEDVILKYFSERSNCVILDSSLKSADLGRYTIIAFDPFLIFESKGNTIRINDNIVINENPLELLRQYIKNYQIECGFKEVPFCGGCIGYFSYDLANFMEELPQMAEDDLNVSDIMLGFYNKSVIIDHMSRKIYAAGASCGMDLPKEEAAMENLNLVKSMLYEAIRIKKNDNRKKEENSVPNKIKSNFNKEDYIKMVERAREYIRNGDIFQVNLSQRFETDIENQPHEIYFELRQKSPAPFSAFLNFDSVKIISTSPERFIKVEGERIETRPIKGTRPRGKDKDTDNAFKKELMESSKDRAELTMIVDLERNDLGRVCRFGSVVVEKHAEVEEYANVFHTVSTVSGKLKKGIDIIDCIYASFPGGSITGAPKIRSMEIIEELEPVKRNIYTGSIGYIGFDGVSDLNICIRTVLIKDNKAYFSVGGGIVWDSEPLKEYEETLHKGRKMIEVLNGENYEYMFG